MIAPVVSLLGLGGATLQVFFMSTRPILIPLTVLSLGYSFYSVYRRPFRSPRMLLRLWATTLIAAILIAIPLFRD